jgi:pyruvate dehydrogenase E2 component (dihydrolipoamide acetyltransferase)
MSIFRLPDLGEGLAEARIVEWHVTPGQAVAAGDLLVSVETAKAVVEIPSPEAGTIRALLAAAGDTVPTQAPLVDFADSGAAATSSGAALPTDNGSVVGRLPHEHAVRAESFVIGRHRHTEARLQQPRARRAARGTPLFDGGEALDVTRRAMAENMARAQREVALVTLTDEAEIRVADHRELTARLVRALAAAARAEPALNAWYDGEQQVRRLHAAVHVGIAVDTPQGLFVPVLKEAGTLELGAIVREVARLKQAAQAQRLTPAQLTGATLTLSNFGALAGRYATPLVMPPQVAILGAGQAFDGLRPQQEEFRRARLLPLSLSFDHRAVTGGEAARFLAAVVADLAQP